MFNNQIMAPRRRPLPRSLPAWSEGFGRLTLRSQQGSTQTSWVVAGFTYAFVLVTKPAFHPGKLGGDVVLIRA